MPRPSEMLTGRLVPIMKCGGCGAKFRLEDPAMIEAYRHHALYGAIVQAPGTRGLNMAKNVEGVRVSVCGTRAIVRTLRGTFHVVCATCGAGGTVPHRTREAAGHACIRDSNKPCRACGAE